MNASIYTFWETFVQKKAVKCLENIVLKLFSVHYSWIKSWKRILYFIIKVVVILSICIYTVLCEAVVNSGTHQQTSNVSRTLLGSKIVDHSDVVGASPVGAAPTTSSFST